jgi:Trypsin
MKVLFGRILLASALVVRMGRCQQQQQQTLRARGHGPLVRSHEHRLLPQGGRDSYGGGDGVDVASILANATAAAGGDGLPVAFPDGSGEAKYLKKVLKLLLEDPAEQESGAGGHADADAADAEVDEEEGVLPGIIAGEKSSPNEFPFFVQAEGAECGATLVAKDVVMTAAHCRGTLGRPTVPIPHRWVESVHPICLTLTDLFRSVPFRRLRQSSSGGSIPPRGDGGRGPVEGRSEPDAGPSGL